MFDKFHILRHRSEVLDQVRRDEYERPQGKEQSFIEGQRYSWLCHQPYLGLDGREALEKLLAAKQRPNTAYLLKRSFGRLWRYRSERGARLLRALEAEPALAAANPHMS